VHSDGADSGLLVGDFPLVLQAYADDKVAAFSSPLGLRRILHAMKRYGDTWGCCAHTDKSPVLLVRPPERLRKLMTMTFAGAAIPFRSWTRSRTCTYARAVNDIAPAPN
jgi:hypothetical protein